MKRILLYIVGAGFLLTSALGCRKESDVLMPYDHNDYLVFSAADTSFAAKFDIIWNGLNQNYALWDYEAQHGLDWDAVYDTCYPKFQALDRRGPDQTVTDKELKELLDEFLGPLHDGHLNVEVKNHITGSTVTFAPSLARIYEREEFETVMSNPLHLSYYADPANGEVETDPDGNPIVMVRSTQVSNLIHAFSSVGGPWINNKIEELEALPEPTDYQAFELQQLKDLREGLRSMNGVTIQKALQIYNGLQSKYGFLEVPGFDYIDPAFLEVAVEFRFALLKGNIAYFGFDHFNLSPYINGWQSKQQFNMDNTLTNDLVTQMKSVWLAWFNCIQELHKEGKLGGVIIDVRSNVGGHVMDSQYVTGPLVKDDYIHFGYQRFKRGTGRYDYSPMMEARVVGMKQKHDDLSDVQVVLLVNCISVSMSETTALCIKTMPNGKTIGKRTFGAICVLTDNEEISYNYSGHIGVKGVTAVYCNVPSMASFTMDGRVIEAQGITPDIEVDFDAAQFQATGRDSQLDRALQYIRTGN